MASSGYEPTYVRGQDPFADLSVEATLIDPKLALPADIQRLAARLAHEESPAPSSVVASGQLPPGAYTRAKVRVNQLGSGNATQIGEMLTPDMDVLMTAHMPTSFDLDDIAGDELGDAREELRAKKPPKSVHAAPSKARVVEPEVSDPIVRPVVDDFAENDEPATVSAYLEHVIPGGRAAKQKQPLRPVDTAPMRAKRDPFTEQPISNKNLAPALDAIDTLDPSLDPDQTLPPVPKRPGAIAFASPRSIPANETTKTNFGPLDDGLGDAIDPLQDPFAYDDDFADEFGDDQIAPLGAEAEEALSFDDLPGLGAASFDGEAVAEKRSFSQILERVRVPQRPRHDVAPQRYIQTKITSNPKIGITPEDTSIVISERDEALDAVSGFADGKPYQLASAEVEALTKPPRRIAPYIIIVAGVIAAGVALFHAIAAPI